LCVSISDHHDIARQKSLDNFDVKLKNTCFPIGKFVFLTKIVNEAKL